MMCVGWMQLGIRDKILVFFQHVLYLFMSMHWRMGNESVGLWTIVDHSSSKMHETLLIVIHNPGWTSNMWIISALQCFSDEIKQIICN